MSDVHGSRPQPSPVTFAELVTLAVPGRGIAAVVPVAAPPGTGWALCVDVDPMPVGPLGLVVEPTMLGAAGLVLGPDVGTRPRMVHLEDEARRQVDVPGAQ